MQNDFMNAFCEIRLMLRNAGGLETSTLKLVTSDFFGSQSHFRGYGVGCTRLDASLRGSLLIGGNGLPKERSVSGGGGQGVSLGIESEAIDRESPPPQALPGNRNSKSHGARPVHLTITIVKWFRTSRLSKNKSLSGRHGKALRRRRSRMTGCRAWTAGPSTRAPSAC